MLIDSAMIQHWTTHS